MKDNEFSEIYLEDVGDLRRDVFPEIYEQLRSQKRAINDLIEEIDIVKSENAELARNQHYIAELLGNLILSLVENGQGVKIVDGNVVLHPTPEFELRWEESDLLHRMTKFKTGRETLIELFGGKYKVENWPQLREVLEAENSEGS
jgi:hypothetical protein